MVSADQVKETARENLDKKIILSVIAAGAILSGLVWSFRKVGLKKVAGVVAKAK